MGFMFFDRKVLVSDRTIFSMKAALYIEQFAVGLRGLYPHEQAGWCRKYCLRGATFLCMKISLSFFPVAVCNALWDDCD